MRQNDEMESLELAFVEVGTLVRLIVGRLHQLLPVFVLRHFSGEQVFVETWLDHVHVCFNRVVERQLVEKSDSLTPTKDDVRCQNVNLRMSIVNNNISNIKMTVFKCQNDGLKCQKCKLSF